MRMGRLLPSSQVQQWTEARSPIRVPGRFAEIAYVTSADVYYSSAASTYEVTLPTTPEVGDLVVAMAIMNNSAPVRTASFSSSQTGTWTDLGERTAAPTMSPACAYVTTAAPLTVTATLDGTSTGLVLAAVLRNVHQSDPVEVAWTQGSVSSSTSPELPSVTTVTDGAYVLAMLWTLDDNTLAAPGGWTQMLSNDYATSRAICVAGRRIPAAGSTGAIVFTETSNGPDSGYGATLALRPV